MIEFISLKNFKTLAHFSMATKKLNLFVGLNGMGKSSVVQALLLLRQSRRYTDLSKGCLLLNWEWIRIGTSRDALYQYAEQREIEFNLDFTTGGIQDTYLHEPDATYLQNKYPKKDYQEDFLYQEALFNDKFQYIRADRKSPATNHLKSYIKLNQTAYSVGQQGENAVALLHTLGQEVTVHAAFAHPKASSHRLLSQTEAWLGAISPGVKIHILPSANNQELQLFFKFKHEEGESNDYRPENVGFGISYILPIIVALLLSDAETLLIIENPEAHLHPKGQAELGKLLAIAAANGTQLFIETHSDHIINGVRVAVKETLINNSDVAIAFLDRPENANATETTFIRMDKKGELSEYPDRFMDEWTNQLSKLL